MSPVGEPSFPDVDIVWHVSGVTPRAVLRDAVGMFVLSRGRNHDASYTNGGSRVCFDIGR